MIYKVLYIPDGFSRAFLPSTLCQTLRVYAVAAIGLEFAKGNLQLLLKLNR